MMAPPSSIFVKKGVKTSAKVYNNTVLGPDVKPLNNTSFRNEHWSFQQDSAPAHKANYTQDWLQGNVLNLTAPGDWPSSSPHLNTLDYKLWAVLEGTPTLTA